MAGAAFLGALLAGAAVFALGRRRGRIAPTRLVLAGVAVGYVLLSTTSFVQLWATPTELRTVRFWMLGSVAGAQWNQIPVVAAVVLVCTALLTGSVIAVVGSIGFVGLMIPHLVRLTTGSDHRRLLPLTALLGAVYLVLVDLLSRTVIRPSELPLGILTALLGAPFFLWLLRRNTMMDTA
ncbi:FecCD family ABC transporter permease [Streptomyces bikiniensis]